MQKLSLNNYFMKIVSKLKHAYLMGTLFTTSAMLNMVLLSVIICHFDVKPQIFSVFVSPLIWKVWSLIPRLFKLDTVSPTARHLCNVSPPWFKAVLARRLAIEMSPATRYIL